MEEQFLTPAEVAQLVRRSLPTVRYWRYKGTGPRSANVGGRVLYRRSDVLAWLEEQYAAEAELPAGA